MPDWHAIRTAYESGISQNSLASKHGVSHQAISKRARKEGWITKLVATPVTLVATTATTATNNDPDDATTADKAIALIAERLDQKPDNKDIKMLMDALSQAYKIKLLQPQDTPDLAEYDMRQFLVKCTDEELTIIRPVIAAVAARDKEAGEKVTPLRKNA